MSNQQSVRLIVDGMSGLISTATAAGATESVNQQLLEYIGKTLEALNSWAVSDAIHPEDRPQSIAAWKHSLETGYLCEVSLGLFRFGIRSQRGLILDLTMCGRYGLRSDKQSIPDAFYAKKVNPKVVPAPN